MELIHVESALGLFPKDVTKHEYSQQYPLCIYCCVGCYSMIASGVGVVVANV